MARISAVSYTHLVLDGTNIIIVKGISKEAVGQYAAEIRAKRAPEPYNCLLYTSRCV